MEADGTPPPGWPAVLQPRSISEGGGPSHTTALVLKQERVAAPTTRGVGEIWTLVIELRTRTPLPSTRIGPGFFNLPLSMCFPHGSRSVEPPDDGRREREQ